MKPDVFDQALQREAGAWTQHWDGTPLRDSRSSFFSPEPLPRMYWDLKYQDARAKKRLTNK
jgi:hypothetical protein